MISVDVMDQVGAKPATFLASVAFGDSEIFSARELIAARVKHEFEKLRFHDEFDPVRSAIYGDLPFTAGISHAEMTRRAIAGFSNRRFLLFVDGRQISGLEEVVRLLPDTKVKFLRLTQLQGG